MKTKKTGPVYKKTWVREFVRNLEMDAFHESLPLDWGRKSPFEKYHWLQMNMENILCFQGGASWDRAVERMSDEFRAWYKEICEIANDLEDPRNKSCDQILQGFDSEVKPKFESIVRKQYVVFEKNYWASLEDAK